MLMKATFPSGKNPWSDFQYMLKYFGIHSVKDLEKYGYTDGDSRNKNYQLARNTIDIGSYEIFELILEQYATCYEESITDFCSSGKDGQFLSIADGLYDKSDINNYLSYFPQKAFIFTGIPMHTTHLDRYDDLQLGLPIDIIDKFYAYESLLVNNCVTLLPREGVGVDSSGGDPEYYAGGITMAHNWIDEGTYKNLAAIDEHVSKNLVTIDKSGKDIINLHTLPMHLTLKLPRFKSARTEDLIELTETYPEKYDRMNRAIAKIVRSCKSDSGLEVLLLREFDDAIYEMESLFKRKRDELLRKGVFAAVGTCFSLIPIVLSRVFEFDATIASSIIGGGSLMSFKPALEKYIEFRFDVSNEDYWILWKWHEHSK